MDGGGGGGGGDGSTGGVWMPALDAPSVEAESGAAGADPQATAVPISAATRPLTITRREVIHTSGKLWLIFSRQYIAWRYTVTDVSGRTVTGVTLREVVQFKDTRGFGHSSLKHGAVLQTDETGGTFDEYAFGFYLPWGRMTLLQTITADGFGEMSWRTFFRANGTYTVDKLEGVFQ